jgi:Protein of unknown function (DUF4240)
MEFWELIAEVRAEVGRTSEWPSGLQVGDALAWHLRRFKPVEILEFDLWLRGQASRADRWELGAACHLICGVASVDGVEEFRYGLVGLGRDDFRAVVDDPDAGLAGLPVVRAMAAGHASPFTIHGDRIRSAPAEAYGGRYLDDRAVFEREAITPRFDPHDAAESTTRLPRLHALFPRRG